LGSSRHERHRRPGAQAERIHVHAWLQPAEAALDQKLGTLLKMHEEAFRQLGGVPEEILYDRMKTVWVEIDDRGEVVWNAVFLDFACYWGFTQRLCRPYLAPQERKTQRRDIRGPVMTSYYTLVGLDRRETAVRRVQLRLLQRTG
jgi:transposase